MAVVSAYASTVYATDTDEILPIAERNLMHNLAKLSPVGTLTLMPRDWADENSEAVTADVVLAADVLYAERLYKPLAATIARILRPNGGVLLMTYCQRAPVNEELFLNGLLSDIGISHAEIDRRELCGQVIVTIRGVRSTQLSTDVHSQNLRSICAEEVVGEVAGIYL